MTCDGRGWVNRVQDSPGAREELIGMFNYDSYDNRFGSAFVNVSVLDKYGFGYGSGQWVRCSDLHGRRYVVRYYDRGKVGILLLDTLFHLCERKRMDKYKAAYHKVSIEGRLARRRALLYEAGQLSFNEYYSRIYRRAIP